jgi:hypothetical protein
MLGNFFNLLPLKINENDQTNQIMGEITEYRIQQIVDNGQIVQMALAEDVHTEPVSQKQLIMESVAKKLDPEMKEQVTPILEAILQAQPTIKVKSYQHTTITITMPKNRYERMGRPQVGEKLEINLKKIS